MTKLKTEWKVKVSSLGAFVGTLAGAVALDVYAPAVVAHAPEALKVATAALVSAAVAWLSGWAARTRPESVSQSTVDAVLRATSFGEHAPRRRDG